jgi:ubiquinone/menaquinone biosynthesis C-methylase UbiE
MTIDCSFNWQEIRRIAGPCIRPGGIVLTERALEVCNLHSGSRVADIGCGVGGTMEHLERTGVYHAVGLDHSEMLLGEAIPLLVAGHRLVRGLAETLPFKKDSFDALFCECVLSIITERLTALHEFARVLKQEGLLIVSDVFCQGSPKRGQQETESQGFQTKGLLTKKDLLGTLARLGFSLLLWEEYQRLLQEFVARMILAGERLPDLWTCRQGLEGKNSNCPQISYFLLVARKSGSVFQSVENKGDGTSWTT